jgi:ABC-2 type transport system ATP-binding protein
MRVQLLQVAIGRGLGAAVPALDLIVDGPVPVVIAVQTDERPLLVSMLLAGRIRSDSGRVLVDDQENADELRRRTALVDTPIVAEPTAGISLKTVVAEEFSGVDGIIITSPERHGGEPTEWYGPLAALAERGVTVAIVTDYATAGMLVALGARDGAEPEPVTPEDSAESDLP